MRIKICCIMSLEEAQMALQYGADALGFVSAMPSGPGVIAEAHIAAIVQALPPETDSFLLTCHQTADAIISQHRLTKTRTLQLCDSLPPPEYEKLRNALPETTLIQVIHVVGEESLAEAQAIAPLVDGLLLDSGNPSLSVKELGGTGRTHNWEISRRICESVGVPVYLAGGLHSENVAEAIRQTRPFGTDICSGVRTEGALDPTKLSRYIAAVRASA